MFRKQPVLVKIEASLTWQFALDPQSGTWIGVCPMLNLNAGGETFADCQAEASEAIGLLLLDLFEDNELEGFLHQNGWRMMDELPAGRTPQFDVPFAAEQGELLEMVATGG